MKQTLALVQRQEGEKVKEGVSVTYSIENIYLRYQKKVDLDKNTMMIIRTTFTIPKGTMFDLGTWNIEEEEQIDNYGVGS